MSTLSSKTRNELRKFVEFIASNVDALGKWSTENHYAVFRKKALRYDYPVPGSPTFRISTDASTDWEYLGWFSLSQNPSFLNGFCKTSVEEMFKTPTFKEFLYKFFERERIMHILRAQLEVMNGFNPIGIKLLTTKNGKEVIAEPFNKSKSYDYVLRKSDETEAAAFVIANHIIDERQYVLLHVNNVLRKNYLRQEHVYRLGTALVHAFVNLSADIVRSGDLSIHTLIKNLSEDGKTITKGFYNANSAIEQAMALSSECFELVHLVVWPQFFPALLAEGRLVTDVAIKLGFATLGIIEDTPDPATTLDPISIVS